ncbi:MULTISPECIES: hypothetical protein [Lactobacillaceae]|uniref:DUF1659 domain-containing protein n=1 Tax=Limosilactobacillus alvi TaxID=990412 RepID=A0ABS2EPS3_9LACO|nr:MULTISPECIES: hypothetical protein [Lactobacillaceae]MBM6754499.1 hypothetical protein [Limosilactobacillus alvi]QLL69448.1 hypothetical protein GTO83_02280 [Lactobacillus sp. 3B(2020)]
MQASFKANKLQLNGTSELHPNGYRRNFNNLIEKPEPTAVQSFAEAIASLTGEQIADGVLTTANNLQIA